LRNTGSSREKIEKSIERREERWDKKGEYVDKSSEHGGRSR
jgi:hypothetical protein